MKKLLTTNITSTSKMPIRKMTLDHLQNAYKETIDAVCASLIGNSYGNIGQFAITGVVNSTPGGLTYTLDAGWIMYNGTLYQFDAATIVCGGGQVPIASIATTYATGDPTEFTDAVSYNIHEIKKITFAAGTSGAGLFDYSQLLFVKVTPDYVGSSTGVAFDTGFDDGGAGVRIFYGRNSDHLVTIEGLCYANGTPSITDVIFTLPATLWPSTQRNFPALIVSGSTGYGGLIVIDTDGEVRCVPLDTDWPNGANYANDDQIFIHANYYRNF